MSRKPTKRGTGKRLSRVWGKLVVKNAGGKCEVCGKKISLNPHHIIGRRNQRLRYDLKNGCCLCSLHHTFGTESAHQDPVWFMNWMLDYRPDDWDYLVTVRNEIKKWTLDEMFLLLDKFTKQLNEV